MLKKKRFQHTVGVESRLCGSKSRGAGLLFLQWRDGRKKERRKGGAKIKFCTLPRLFLSPWPSPNDKLKPFPT